MSRKNKNRNNARKKRSERPESRRNIDGKAGWPDLCIHVIDAFLELVNNSKLIAAIVMIVAILAIVTAIRLPEAAIAPFWTGLFSLFSSQYLAYGLLLFTNWVWCITFMSLKRETDREIKRVTELRKILMHGLTLGELKTIPVHTSSQKDDIDSTLIFPIDDKTDNDEEN